MSEKITNIAPGMLEYQRKVSALSRLVQDAVMLAQRHDEFINAKGKSDMLKVSVFGLRGGVAATFTTQGPRDFEEVFGVIMKILNERVASKNEAINRAKEDLG